MVGRSDLLHGFLVAVTLPHELVHYVTALVFGLDPCYSPGEFAVRTSGMRPGNGLAHVAFAAAPTVVFAVLTVLLWPVWGFFPTYLCVAWALPSPADIQTAAAGVVVFLAEWRSQSDCPGCGGTLHCASVYSRPACLCGECDALAFCDADEFHQHVE